MKKPTKTPWGFSQNPPPPHWAKMGLIFPRTPFPSENSLYSKVKQIASFEK